MAEPVVLPYRGIMPRIDPSVYLAPNTVVMGDVEIGPECSIWPGVILRGDMGVIRIGARTNIQDGAIVHVTYGCSGTHIGAGVTVGHMALLHECIVEDRAFIGMRATVLDGAKVESEAMLGACALLPSGKTVGRRELWVGCPAKFHRAIPDEESEGLCDRAREYAELAAVYRTVI